MPDYQRRFQAAEMELEEAGFWLSNAIPPYIWFLRKLGLKPVPPHYIPLGRSFLGHMIFFVILLGVVSYNTQIGAQNRSIIEFGTRTILSGLIYGLIMLTYYAVSRRKSGLSRWEDL